MFILFYDYWNNIPEILNDNDSNILWNPFLLSLHYEITNMYIKTNN